MPEAICGMSRQCAAESLHIAHCGDPAAPVRPLTLAGKHGMGIACQENRHEPYVPRRERNSAYSDRNDFSPTETTGSLPPATIMMNLRFVSIRSNPGRRPNVPSLPVIAARWRAARGIEVEHHETQGGVPCVVISRVVSLG
jgi:hypothetical protein